MIERQGNDGCHTATTGIDRDEDDYIVEAEQISRVRVCPDDELVEGDVMVGNASDVAELSLRKHVTGQVVVAAPELESLQLDALSSIGGRLTISGNSKLAEIRVPNLHSVGRDRDSQPDIEIVDNEALATLDLDSLQWVAGGVLIRNNPNLERCSVEDLQAQLESVDWFLSEKNGPIQICTEP